MRDGVEDLHSTDSESQLDKRESQIRDLSFANLKMGIDHGDQEVESCGSRATIDSTGKQGQQQRQKLEVYNEVLTRLLDSGVEETRDPGFEDNLWLHFNRLPSRYAMDVNVERAEDVLIHKRLLKLAEDPANRPVIEVRLVHFFSPNDEPPDTPQVSTGRGSVRGPPTFGSSTNLESMLHQGSETPNPYFISRPMHEITFSTIDRPKLLSQLTCLLADIGLNIQEAHAFSTFDGFSLDVFVVDGWDQEETEKLRNVLEKEIITLKEDTSPVATSVPVKHVPEMGTDNIEIPSDGTDDWEINSQMLQMGNKVASGSFGDLYKGSYCSQEVAIKVLKPERLSSELLREFKQEVFIMRKIRHKNVVQFIGACTKPPNLCIVTEFMARGSIYDYLHKQNCVFKLSSLIKVAIDVSRGMSYLHQNNIIHRDLKTANLLMDENEVVKVADFGVARVLNGSGVMTAETGTYRWMAPEVIEHKPYDQKADVFSFAIVLWELITAELPYAYLTPLQAAIGVVQKDLRPTIPKHTHPRIAQLIVRCWERDTAHRPNFSEIIEILQSISKEVVDDRKPAGGLFATLRKGH